MIKTSNDSVENSKLTEGSMKRGYKMRYALQVRDAKQLCDIDENAIDCVW